MRTIELTTGEAVPADGSHRELKENGQQKGYVVLSEEERRKGFVKPYRDAYIHAKCGGLTTMGRALSETYARDPHFYSGTFCVGCGAHFPLNQFNWDDGEPMDPTLQDVWAAAEQLRISEREIAARSRLEASERAELARLKSKYEP